VGKRRSKRAKLKECEGTPKPRERGRGDRGVRGSIALGAVGRKRPRSDIRRPFERRLRKIEARQRVSSLQSAEAFSDVVKHPVPW